MATGNSMLGILTQRLTVRCRGNNQATAFVRGTLIGAGRLCSFRQKRSFMSVPLSPLWVRYADYDFGDPETMLGRGALGRVLRAIDRKSGKPVAVKILYRKIESDHEELCFFREVSILAANSHPALLSLSGFGTDPSGFPMIITEMMTHKTIEAAFKSPPCEWNATRKSIAVFGICAAMAYLHRQNIIHRDLKPDNVYLNDQ
jgi:hypothetical protein